MKRLVIFFLLFLPIASGAQTSALKQQVLKQIIQKPSGPNFAVVSAKLRAGTDIENAYKQLDTLLVRPYGDMFWMYGCAGLYLSTQDVLRPEYKARIRECWKHFTPYRGDTENHFLMYYGSLMLMSEVWPDLGEQEWFTGQTSKEIHNQAADYLDHWIDEVARYGQIEFDSPRYQYYFITPLVLLAEFAHDARMKKRCQMMLEYFLVDHALEYLNGNYCGAHSRVSDQAAIDPRSGEATAYGEYFFSDQVTHLEPDLAFAALSSFVCPEIIRTIANDRSKPFTNIKMKRGRTTIRDSKIRNATIVKHDYMTKDYCLGSMEISSELSDSVIGALAQPIQQQTWSLVFAGEKKHNILFSLHPNFDARELAEFFPEEPSFMLERIGAVKAGYPNENKWVGGSPYERVFQNENELLAYYDIPESAKYRHVDLYIPKAATILSRDQTSAENDIFILSAPGWIVLKYDSTLVGVRIMSPYDLTDEGDNYRIRTKTGNTACWIICVNQSEMTADDFAKKLLHLEPVKRGSKVTFPSITGKSIHFDLAQLSNYKITETHLFASRFASAKLGSGILWLRAGKLHRALDFIHAKSW
jgi:hypothetical protein